MSSIRFMFCKHKIYFSKEISFGFSMSHRHAEGNHCIVNHIGFSTIIDFVLILFTESESIKCLKIIMP